MQSRRVHGAVLGQARLRAGVVVVMLPGDLSSPRLRLPSAEKQGRVWTRLLRDDVIDPLEWWRGGEVHQGAARGAKEREARGRTARGVPWLVVSATEKLPGLFTGVLGNDAGVQAAAWCGSSGESESQREMRIIWTNNFTRSGHAQRHVHVNAFESRLKNNYKHVLLE